MKDANVEKAYGRLIKLYNKHVLSTVDPMDLCLYGKIKCKPLDKQLLQSAFKDIPESQIKAVHDSIDKLNQVFIY